MENERDGEFPVVIRPQQIKCIRCGLLGWMIPVSVGLSVLQTGCAKAAERINVLFGVEIPGGPRNAGPHL